MTEEELVECFSTLLGVSPEGGRSDAGHTHRQGESSCREHRPTHTLRLGAGNYGGSSFKRIPDLGDMLVSQDKLSFIDVITQYVF